jgi:hypothetical protein
MNFRLASIAMLTAALSGCASYVNIPPDSNEDIAINAINAPPTPGIITAALNYVLIEHPAPSKPYGVRLPVEASDTTWTKVLRGRDGAVPFAQVTSEPVYDVRSIRVRGTDAWVDIVVPATRDNRPLVELRLDGAVSGWTVTSVRHWSASVIRQRESSGQYGPTTSVEPTTRSTLRPIVVGTPKTEPEAAPAEEVEAIDAAIEPEVATPQERRALTPIRPVKPEDKP